MGRNLQPAAVLVRIIIVMSAVLAWGSYPSSRACAQVAEPEVADEPGGADEPAVADDPEGGDDEGAGNSDRGRDERSFGPSEREKKVLELFHASSKSFEKGVLVLGYNFESNADDLASDWLPVPDRAIKSRLHWATPGELDILSEASSNSYSSAKPRRLVDGAMILADFGTWAHKAVFLKDVEMTVDLLNFAHPREGTILAPAFHDLKKKLSLGNNGGHQAVCLKGVKPTRPGSPKVAKLIPWRNRQTIGYQFDGKTFQCLLNDKKTCDTSSAPQLTAGFDVGQPGMTWTGSVKAYVFHISIRGRLDPDWVSEQLGEKGAKSTGGDKAGTQKKSKAKG